MFERYTEQARRVLFFARYEATQTGDRLIEPGHLLLGLIREDGGRAAGIPSATGLSAEEIRSALSTRGDSPPSDRATGPHSSHEIPFSPEARRALHFAAEEADGLGHQQIGVEHLLLGAIRMESSTASLLAGRGLDLDTLRQRAAVNAAAAAKRDSRPGVRITPTARTFEQGTSARQEMTSWTLEGLNLRRLLSAAYDFPDTRIDVPADVDGAGGGDRYDAVVSSGTEPLQSLHGLLQHGLEQHFKIAVTRETRLTDVYVLTTHADGAKAVKESDQDGGGLGAFSVEDVDVVDDPSLSEDELRAKAIERFKSLMTGAPREVGAIDRMSAAGGIEVLCGMLERGLGRPVLDETRLIGSYRWDVQSEGRSTGAFLDALRDQTGVVATPAQRDLTFLVVRRR